MAAVAAAAAAADGTLKKESSQTKERRKNGKGDFVVLCSIVAHSGRATLRPAAGPERERELERDGMAMA